MGQIAKQYNGLPLSHVEWTDSKTGQSVQGYTDGSPGPYSCVAYYKGIQSSVVMTEYTANITYTGEVTKEIVTGTEVKAVYVGSPSSPNRNTLPFVIGGSSLALCTIGGIGFLIMKLRKGAMLK